MNKETVSYYNISDFLPQEDLEQMWLWDWQFEIAWEHCTIVNIQSVIDSLDSNDGRVPSALSDLARTEPSALIRLT